MNRIHDRIHSAALKTRSTHTRAVLIACILIAQLALIAFWTAQRSNYYIDELYSFGSAHTFTLDKKYAVYINRSEAWQYESWVDNAALKSQLRVAEDESLLSQPPLTAIRMLLLRRNYFAVLNLLMSLFSHGEISMYPAIVLNGILFVLAQLVLYRIMKELTGSFAVSALTILMYGFSAMAISTVLYVRFYMLVTLLLLLLIRLHQIMWREEKLLHCELLTLLSMALLYFAMKDSELVFIVGGALTAAYTVGLLIGRQYKKAGLYAAAVFPVGIMYAVLKTSFVDIILHPGNYAKSSGAEGWMTNNLLTVNKGRIIALIFKYLGWVSDLMFGSWYVLCCFVILILILLEVRALGKKRPDAEGKPDKRTGFVGVIAGVCLVYYIFALLTAIPAERYFMFYFPMLTILFWKLLHELSAGLRYRCEVLAVSLVLVLAGVAALQCLRPEKIDFIYAEDRPFIQSVRESEIKDAVVIFTDERDSNHSVYECVYLLPDSARLYPINTKKQHIDLSSCPDEVLVWIHYDRSPESYITDLLEAGYELTEYGGTYASDVYIARKRS